MNIKNILGRLIKIFVFSAVLVLGGIFAVNCYVKRFSAPKIISADEAADIGGADCILVLGAAVKDGVRPSDMLKDRLITGVALYDNNSSGKILMSGDHGRNDYDEVNVMKQFAVDNSVPSEDVFMDHAGFSTYESLYRAKEIFKADKIIIVSQKYHLYRAVYIAEKLGIDAYGVSADIRNYKGQTYRNLREAAARVKDFFGVILKPEPKYLGEAVPVSGNGNITNDK